LLVWVKPEVTPEEVTPEELGMRATKLMALNRARSLIQAQIDYSSCQRNGNLQLKSEHCRKCHSLVPCSWYNRTKVTPISPTDFEASIQSELELDRNLAVAHMLIQQAAETFSLSQNDRLAAQHWLATYDDLFSQPSPIPKSPSKIEVDPIH
jgi:hypothetical protein